MTSIFATTMMQSVTKSLGWCFPSSTQYVSNYIYVGQMVVMKDRNMREPLRNVIHAHVR